MASIANYFSPSSGGANPSKFAWGEDKPEQRGDREDEPPGGGDQTPPAKRVKREVGRELINLLSATEIQQTYLHQVNKNTSLTSNGCLKNTLAAKGDGYVQVTPSGIVKASPRWVELFGEKAKAAQKVLWHQLAWRYHNQCKTIPYTDTGEAIQLGHTCSERACGAKAHLRLVTRSENESQKKCGYVHTIDEKTAEPSFYLACVHTPPCVPQTRQSTPLTAVKDATLVLELKVVLRSNVAVSSTTSLTTPDSGSRSGYGDSVKEEGRGEGVNKRE